MHSDRPPSNPESPNLDRLRDHQANERTFLAWLRTAIALIGFGLAIARFGLFLRQLDIALTQVPPRAFAWHSSEILGISLVLLGILSILLAAWRYNQIFWQIEQADFRPTRWAVWVMTGTVITLGVLSLPLLLWRDFTTPLPPEKDPLQSSSHFSPTLRLLTPPTSRSNS